LNTQYSLNTIYTNIRCNIIIRNGQTILELAMSSKNVTSDMVSVERTLLVIGSKNAVSHHALFINMSSVYNKTIV